MQKKWQGTSNDSAATSRNNQEKDLDNDTNKTAIISKNAQTNPDNDLVPKAEEEGPSPPCPADSDRPSTPHELPGVERLQPDPGVERLVVEPQPDPSARQGQRTEDGEQQPNGKKMEEETNPANLEDRQILIPIMIMILIQIKNLIQILIWILVQEDHQMDLEDREDKETSNPEERNGSNSDSSSEEMLRWIGQYPSNSDEEQPSDEPNIPPEDLPDAYLLGKRSLPNDEVPDRPNQAQGSYTCCCHSVENCCYTCVCPNICVCYYQRSKRNHKPNPDDDHKNKR